MRLSHYEPVGNVPSCSFAGPNDFHHLDSKHRKDPAADGDEVSVIRQHRRASDPSRQMKFRVSWGRLPALGRVQNTGRQGQLTVSGEAEPPSPERTLEEASAQEITTHPAH